MQKEIKIKGFTTRKKILEEISKYDNPILTGSISDLKKLKIDQGSDIGAKIVPDPEVIKAKDFTDRQELDDYVKNLLGDNITINKHNSHSIEGTEKELSRLMLSETSTVWGCRSIKLTK